MTICLVTTPIQMSPMTRTSGHLSSPEISHQSGFRNDGQQNLIYIEAFYRDPDIY